MLSWILESEAGLGQSQALTETEPRLPIIAFPL